MNDIGVREDIMDMAELDTAAIRLLEQSKIILDAREKTLAPLGASFNVFSILRMEANEVDTHSRMLFELLSSEGSHGMGERFLREFFALVLDKPFQDGAAVYREYKINEAGNYGRIDLLVEGDNFRYPVEVKIYAGDQYRQIERYHSFAAKAKEHHVYYLTLDGHEPSQESLGSICEADYSCLSFATDIRPWLVRCGEIAWQIPAIAGTIQQYIHLIDMLTQSVKGDVFMDIIQKTVGLSRENYEAAAAIEQSLEPLRVEMMRRVFREIEEHIGSRLQKHSSSYETDAVQFYSSNRKKVWPSLTYLVKQCGKLTIAFRVEADWNLFCGFIFFDENYAQVPGQAKELIDAFDSEDWKELITTYTFKDWWLWWDYLPEDPINFKELNGIYPELYDAKRHEEIMAEVFCRIDQLLDNSLETGWCGGTF